MNHHVVTYAGGLDPTLDAALREAIPGHDGSGFMSWGADVTFDHPPELPVIRRLLLRDLEFVNDWPQERVEETAEAICGLRFKGAYTLSEED